MSDIDSDQDVETGPHPPTAPEPVPPEPTPSPPPTPPDPTPGHPLWVVLALMLLTVAILPLLLSLWGITALAFEEVTAEALQHTDGLDPETFAFGWYTAWAVDLGVIGWCLVRRLRTRRDPARRPWRPLQWLWSLYLIGLWAAVPTDILSPYDVNDELTTFLLLGTVTLIEICTPLLLLVLLARALATLWRSARASLPGYRRVVGLSSALGLGTAAVTGAYVVGIQEGYFDELGEELLASWQVGATGIYHLPDNSRNYYVSASSALVGDAERATPSAATPGAGEQQAHFAECASELLTPTRGERAQYERAVDHLTYRWKYIRADAEDAAMEALVRACRAYMKSPKSHLVEYYWTTLGNLRKDRHERDELARDAMREIERRLREKRDTQTIPIDEYEEKLKREVFEAAFRSLSLLDRQILEMRFDEKRYRTIGWELGITERAARKRYERAERRFYAAVFRELQQR